MKNNLEKETIYSETNDCFARFDHIKLINKESFRKSCLKIFFDFLCFCIIKSCDLFYLKSVFDFIRKNIIITSLNGICKKRRENINCK